MMDFMLCTFSPVRYVSKKIIFNDDKELTLKIDKLLQSNENGEKIGSWETKSHFTAATSDECSAWIADVAQRNDFEISG